MARWTHDDIAVLGREWWAGKSADDIGVMIGRTGKNITAQAWNLRLQRNLAEPEPVALPSTRFNCGPNPLPPGHPVSWGPISNGWAYPYA